MKRQNALARYDAALEAANQVHAAIDARVGGYVACNEADYRKVIQPARAMYDTLVAAAFAAYQQEVS